jgi:hypothetical protein
MVVRQLKSFRIPDLRGTTATFKLKVKPELFSQLYVGREQIQKKLNV